MRVRLDLDYRLAKVILCPSLNAWHCAKARRENQIYLQLVAVLAALP